MANTLYEVGDKVWYLKDDKIEQGTIVRIELNYTDTTFVPSSIVYSLKRDNNTSIRTRNESEIYPTEEALKLANFT